MRPLKLSMTAFLSYKNRTELDLSQLGMTGVYLITGNIGAGKTAIFDAICFALYGEGSGQNRKTAEELRCISADGDTLTRVELEFEYRNNIYKVDRVYNHGIVSDLKTTLTCDLDEMANAEGDKAVNAKLIEILGIEKIQFSYMAMIAQGEFSRLITEKTLNMVDVFRMIFSTQKYSALQDRLSKDENAAKTSLNMIKSDVLEKITQFVRYNGIDDFDDRKIKSCMDSEEGLKACIRRFEQCIEEAHEQLEMKVGEHEKLENLLKKIDNEINTLTEYKDIRLRADRLEEKKAELKIRATDLKAAEEQAASINSNNEEIAEIKRSLNNDAYAKINDLSKQIIDLKKQINADLSEKYSCAYAVLKRLSKMCDEALKLSKDYSDAEKALEYAGSASKDADDKYTDLYKSFLHEQSGILAQQLENGEKCPVCGSTEHPFPAQKSKNAPSRKEVDAAFENAKRLREAHSHKKSQSVDLRNRLTVVRNDICSHFQRFFGEEEENTTVIRARLLDRLTELNVEASERSFNLIPNTKLPESISELIDRYNSVAKDIETNEKLLESHQKHYEDTYNENKRTLKYPSAAEAQRRIDELNDENSRFELRYNNTKKTHDELNDHIRIEEGIIRDWKNVHPDVEELSKEGVIAQLDSKNCQRDEIQASVKRSNQEIIEAKSRDNNNAERLSELKLTKIPELIKAKATHTMIKDLSDTANGRLPKKEQITLEAYVQSMYFNRVLNKANAWIDKLTGNRYRLKIRKSTQKGSRKTGLDINVVDVNDGTERRAAGLSGGESFLVSISLALGLSDEILSSSGKAKFDSLYIDEGLGTLDNEKRELFIKVLSELTENNKKLVGIISHIDELEDNLNIHNKIMIYNDTVTHTSRVEFNINDKH